ncbi:FAD/NAD(P)-binding domain-containing protein [Aspergillus campestris IBT 28561]|uniref:FAD/NAD(P)-binding domain-containing protein n=1 Tax=Aspergillus campestris (strain IBT 28561) TaxID=1392248 RepID=A0A2I1CWI0_ASPC2|nr:FAD/NAD(P)-binding domain-containing protein [Aspergillus campestris IBT 28561]PKY01987.1 FAD/NAD(P)-binding domain-containing protein [Aspergillus campestris IBT 28561]
MEQKDITIVGAGWAGLAALRTMRETHPDASLLLLDDSSSIGGVWAKHRLYSGVKSNNMRGTYEYSDFPMDDSFGVKEGEHIPGAVIQQYMERFVEHFNIASCIRLSTAVTDAEQQADDKDGWILRTRSTTDESTSTISTKKLVVCTGITSKPYMPTLAGQETFERPILHISSLRVQQDQILHAGKTIAVYGGTKSAWDAVYAAATAGCKVEWIIRDNGHGPTWMAPPYVTPMKRWLEKLVTTRLLTWFSPCIWGPADGSPTARSLLHNTRIGRAIVDAFWSTLESDVVSANNYDAHPETAKLRPWISPFWIASGLSILNYKQDFFSLLTAPDSLVSIHIDRITSLSSDGTITLANATDPSTPTDTDTSSPSFPSDPATPTTLNADALVLATGWQAHSPPIAFHLRSPETTTLGFPSDPDPIPSSMVTAATENILTRFPRLATPPPKKSASTYTPLASNAPASASHPMRLTRFMVPPSLLNTHNIAFMGLAMTINTTMLAQAQSLWIAAHFSNKLRMHQWESCPADVRATVQSELSSAGRDLKFDEVDVLWETALHTEFGKLRYPGGFGARNPDFVFDALPYVDLLLRDLGVGWERKSGIFGRVVKSYGMEDYVGLLGEWIRTEAKKEAHKEAVVEIRVEEAQV